MSLRSHKIEAKELLLSRNRSALVKWAYSVRSSLRNLMSITYDKDELLKWRAIEAVGWVAALQAERDPEKVRDTLRRLLWLMNDESGGLGWHSPELIGEILVNVPSLIPEYAGLLPSFLYEEPFERGIRLALWRIASVKPEPLVDSAAELRGSLDDSDPAIRGYTGSALLALQPETNRDVIGRLQDDKGQVQTYDFGTGKLRDTTVGQMIRDAAGKPDSSDRVA